MSDNRKTATLILASTSPFRRMLMANAGLNFHAMAADVDERAIENELQKRAATPQDVAKALAGSKAADVSSRHMSALVIGADQTLSLDGRVFHKPGSLAEAREHLMAFSGKTHQLNSGVAIVQNGKMIWSHVASAKMSVRPLSPAFIDGYLEQAGDKVLGSVGAYQLEGQGIQLFDAIDGDHFTILGLPMLPLLAILRDMGAIDG